VEQTCYPNARVCESSVEVSLSRQHVLILILSSGLASHEKTQLSHPLSTFARLRTTFHLATVLLVKFLLTSLALLLETFHNIYGATIVYILIDIPIVAVRRS